MLRLCFGQARRASDAAHAEERVTYSTGTFAFRWSRPSPGSSDATQAQERLTYSTGTFHFALRWSRSATRSSRPATRSTREAPRSPRPATRSYLPAPRASSCLLVSSSALFVPSTAPLHANLVTDHHSCYVRLQWKEFCLVLLSLATNKSHSGA